LVDEILSNLAKKLPRFSDGRLNYTNSKEAAIVSVSLWYEDKLLLLKRSDKVGNYKGYWNVVAGYYDDFSKSPQQKGIEEAKEEVGLEEKNILKIQVGKYHKLIDDKIDKTFYVFPIKISLFLQSQIKLDWEHTEYRWIDSKELNKFQIVYKLDEILRV